MRHLEKGPRLDEPEAGGERDRGPTKVLPSCLVRYGTESPNGCQEATGAGAAVGIALCPVCEHRDVSPVRTNNVWWGVCADGRSYFKREFCPWCGRSALSIYSNRHGYWQLVRGICSRTCPKQEDRP